MHRCLLPPRDDSGDGGRQTSFHLSVVSVFVSLVKRLPLPSLLVLVIGPGGAGAWQLCLCQTGPLELWQQSNSLPPSAREWLNDWIYSVKRFGALWTRKRRGYLTFIVSPGSISSSFCLIHVWYNWHRKVNYANMSGQLPVTYWLLKTVEMSVWWSSGSDEDERSWCVFPAIHPQLISPGHTVC